MCSICGIIGINGPNNNTRLGGMLQNMSHRGPDGTGRWSNQSVSFGHGRLAINDISDAGNQPMHLSPGIHCIVNGEVYNYPQLRKDLEDKYGVRFNSDCDSEIVLHGYAKYGEEFFKLLNGMFAFALYDEKKQKVFLVRDRLGIKPIYYTNYNNEFIFASEIKGIFGAIDTNSWTINAQALSEYLTYQTALGSLTLFQHIYILEPGHILTIDLTKDVEFELKKFWESKSEPNDDISFDDSVKQYKKILTGSVERHLLSDVPVASYLSAGFDSASVYAQAALINKPPMSSYTGWFNIGKEGWYDETGPARKVVDKVQGHHNSVNISYADFIDNLDNIVDALDEPKMGMGAFSQYMIAKVAAQNFKVILTGHGGDELFSGYPVFKLAQKRAFLSAKASEIPHLAYYSLSNMRSAVHSEFGRYLPVLWSMEDQKKLFNKNLDFVCPWKSLSKIQTKCHSKIEQVFQIYLNAYLPNLLVVEDKISMAHQLESRTPLLDNQMLDFSLKIPHSVKLHQNELKAIIKAGASDLLPSDYYSQPKRGFPTPLRLWLRGPLNQYMNERILGPDSRLSRLFDQETLYSFIHRYNNSVRKFARPLDEIQTHRVWQMLCLDAWLRVWEEKYGITLKLP